MVKRRRKRTVKTTKPIDEPIEEVIPKKPRRKSLKQKRKENKLKKEREELKKNPLKRTRYKKQRCMFIKPNGERCNRWAIGRSTLCKAHGGTVLTPETALPSNSILKVQNAAKFDVAVHPISFIEYSKEGLSEVEIAAKFKVSTVTIKKWAAKFQEFSIAYEVGKSMYEAWWLTKGKGGLDDYKFNTSLYKFLTGNLLGYSDKIETKNQNVNSNFGVLVVPDKLSVDEWEKKVEASKEVIDI